MPGVYVVVGVVGVAGTAGDSGAGTVAARGTDGGCASMRRDGNDSRFSTSSAGAIGVPGLDASTLGAALDSGDTDVVPGRGDVPGDTVP